jgi:glycosyltransferase 2 family protein
MKKKLALGVLVGGLLAYLSIRGISPAALSAALRVARIEYLLLAMVGVFVVQVLRTVRWGTILRPLGTIPPLPLFSITSVGFLAIVALPARLGELVRPYLVTGISGIAMSAAVGTILVERICDGLTIMAILAAVLCVLPLPAWVLEAGAVFLFVTVSAMSLMLFLALRKETAIRTVRPLLERLPANYSGRLEAMIRSFADGFTIVFATRSLVFALLLSVLIWLANIGVIASLFFAFRLDLPWTAAFVLMIIMVIGIAIPAAPGFIGNWHFFCSLGLGLFGVARPEALAYAIVYHFLSMAIVVTLGLVFLPFNRFSLADLRRQPVRAD